MGQCRVPATGYEGCLSDSRFGELGRTALSSSTASAPLTGLMDHADGSADPIEEVHALTGNLWRISVDHDLYAFESRLGLSVLVHLI